MSGRSKAGPRATPLALHSVQGPRSRRDPGETGERCTAWSVYRDAIDDGWGATCRLCLILIFRWGFPVTAFAVALKFILILLGHAQ